MKEAHNLGKELERIHKKRVVMKWRPTKFQLQDLDDKEANNREKVLSMMYLHFKDLEHLLHSSSNSSSSSSSSLANGELYSRNYWPLWNKRLDSNLRQTPRNNLSWWSWMPRSLLRSWQMKRKLYFSFPVCPKPYQERGLENLHQGVQRLQQLANMEEKILSERKMEPLASEREPNAMISIETGIEYLETKNKTRTRLATNVRLRKLSSWLARWNLP